MSDVFTIESPRGDRIDIRDTPHDRRTFRLEYESRGWQIIAPTDNDEVTECQDDPNDTSETLDTNDMSDMSDMSDISETLEPTPVSAKRRARLRARTCDGSRSQIKATRGRCARLKRHWLQEHLRAHDDDDDQ